MLFTSTLFLTIFLPLFLLVYYRAQASWRNAVALIFSLAFYFWGAPGFLPVVLALGGVNYWLSRQLMAQNNERRRRFMVLAGVGLHLTALFYYKYLNFAVGNLVPFAQWFVPEMKELHFDILLPLGVSFITFEQISYLMDVYRRDTEPARKLSDYYLFLLLFPHSIAGPIFRWKDLAPQMESRNLEDGEIFQGFVRFIYGLTKKALIANYMAFPADQVFSLPNHELGFSIAWIGAIAYTLQIYFDFSAYSDMAIGIGQMTGFRFKENFQYPYLSRSISEFWERWHISLTTWFRLYLYIPLGGNRVSALRTYINILLVFVISGFWHGAAWTFVIWGLYNGVLILLERRFGWATSARGELGRTWSDWRTVTTMVLVAVGWVFFRAQDLSQAMYVLKAMAGLSGNPEVLSKPMALLFPYRCLAMMIAGLLWVAIEPRIYGLMMNVRRFAVSWVTLTLAFYLSLASLANSTYNPFIYFKF